MGAMPQERGLEKKNGIRADGLEGLCHSHPAPGATLGADMEQNNASEDTPFLQQHLRCHSSTTGSEDTQHLPRLDNQNIVSHSKKRNMLRDRN